MWCFFFFFNDTATTEIYTLSLHDALPIYRETFLWPSSSDIRISSQSPKTETNGQLPGAPSRPNYQGEKPFLSFRPIPGERDRKSTRLNSSHANISYAVFCLKKKKNTYSIV